MMFPLYPGAIIFTDEAEHKRYHEKARNESDSFVKRYTAIAQATGREQIALLLAEFIFDEYFNLNHTNESTLAEMIFKDWQLYLPHLSLHSTAFSDIIHRYYYRAIGVINRGERGKIPYAVWLATMMPELQRKLVVKALLRYILGRQNYNPLNSRGQQTERKTENKAAALDEIDLQRYLPFWIEMVMHPTPVAQAKPNLYPSHDNKKPEDIVREAKKFIINAT